MILEQLALDRAREILEKALDLPVFVKPRPPRDRGIDAEFAVGSSHFLVEVKSDARSASVARAIEQLQSVHSRHASAALLLVVPHMGDAGAELCRQAQVNWIDLHGNASIRDRTIRVHIRGLYNDAVVDIEKQNGVNPFSHKASRVAHVLLSDVGRLWSRAEIQKQSKLDKGFVSKILGELADQGYLKIEAGKGRIRDVRIRNPMVLLDACFEHYRPPKCLAWGLLAVGDGFETEAKMSEIFEKHEITYAVTGLPAAAHYTNFGNFRRVDVYISEIPDSAVLTALNCSADSRGRNIALIEDEFGATVGVQKNNVRRYASPSLVYLDLANLPERSAEAREEMRRYLENLWK